MQASEPNSATAEPPQTSAGPSTGEAAREGLAAARDLSALTAVEILGAHIADLMTAAAVKLGLFEGGEEDRDLAEARILITALAGLIDGSAANIGSQHAAPVRDGLKSLQLAFREYSPVPDAPGEGPGERYSGPVYG